MTSVSDTSSKLTTPNTQWTIAFGSRYISSYFWFTLYFYFSLQVWFCEYQQSDYIPEDDCELLLLLLLLLLLCEKLALKQCW